MTEKEKQIEEIAKDLKQIKYSIPDEIDDRYRVITHLDKRGAKEFAASLAEAGYRKQSEVAENIIKMLKAAKPVVKVHFEAYDELIENIAAEYGVEVEK